MRSFLRFLPHLVFKSSEKKSGVYVMMLSKESYDWNQSPWTSAPDNGGQRQTAFVQIPESSGIELHLFI